MEAQVPNRTRVLLADDHTLVADGVAAVLGEEFELLGRVADGRELVAAVGTLAPDVVVTDIGMPVLNGIDALREVKEIAPRTWVVMVTMYDNPYLAAEAIRAGASGYVLKHSAGTELIQAVREAAAGREYISPLVARDLVASLVAGGSGAGGRARLTARQRQVLRLVAEGHTMKEVATLLKVSRRTAESHKYLVMDLLGARSTAELVRHAIRMGLVTLDEAPASGRPAAQPRYFG
jgi:DNA-binding NarL/FixJ family response regulator